MSTHFTAGVVISVVNLCFVSRDLCLSWSHFINNLDIPVCRAANAVHAPALSQLPVTVYVSERLKS